MTSTFIIQTDTPLDLSELSILLATPLTGNSYLIPWAGDGHSLLHQIQSLAPKTRVRIVPPPAS